MFARHMFSGRPVLADWARINSSGVCAPAPIGTLPFMYSSPARETLSISSSIVISSSTSRARCALRMSLWRRPPLARLTFAIGSPVTKWTTSSTSRLWYGCPQRSTGISIISVNSHGGRCSQSPVGSHAAHAIPCIELAGGSRSPSSRSRNPGMKNSLVSVVILTRPDSPYFTTLSGLSKSTT